MKRIKKLRLTTKNKNKINLYESLGKKDLDEDIKKTSEDYYNILF